MGWFTKFPCQYCLQKTAQIDALNLDIRRHMEIARVSGDEIARLRQENGKLFLEKSGKQNYGVSAFSDAQPKKKSREASLTERMVEPGVLHSKAWQDEMKSVRKADKKLAKRK